MSMILGLYAFFTNLAFKHHKLLGMTTSPYSLFNYQLRKSPGDRYVNAPTKNVIPSLNRWSYEIANGMVYLASKKVNTNQNIVD